MTLPDRTSLIAGTSRDTGIQNQLIASAAEYTGQQILNNDNLDELLDLEVIWQYNVNGAPIANRTVEIRLIPWVDQNSPVNTPLGFILIRAFSPPVNTTEQYRMLITDFPLPPYRFQVNVRNVDTGATIRIWVNAFTRKAVQIID